MQKNSVILKSQNTKRNSFEEDIKSQYLQSDSHQHIFSSNVEDSQLIEKNVSQAQSTHFKYSFCSNAEQILKKVAQEVSNQHDINTHQTQNFFQRQIRQLSEQQKKHLQQLKPKTKSLKKNFNKRSDQKIKRDIDDLKMKFNKSEKPISKQEIWRIHDKYTFIIQSMAKELYQQRKKYQQLLLRYKNSQNNQNKSNIFEGFKKKQIPLEICRQNSNELLTIDEVSEQYDKTSMGKLSQDQQQTKNIDIYQYAIPPINEFHLDMKKSKTTENLANKYSKNNDNVIDQCCISQKLKFQNSIQDIIRLKIPNLLQYKHKNCHSPNTNISQQTLENYLDCLSVTDLQKFNSPSLINIMNQSNAPILQLKAKYQAIFIERQCKNQEYINAVDEYYQSHINEIYQNIKNTLNVDLKDSKTTEQDLQKVENLQISELKRQMSILKANNKKIIQILGQQMQGRIKILEEQINRQEFSRQMQSYIQLKHENKQLNSIISRLQNQQLKCHNCAINDVFSSRSFLNEGCQTLQTPQKQTEITQVLLLSQRIKTLQNKIKELQETRQVNSSIFSKQKQLMRTSFEEHLQELASNKSKKDKYDQNIQFFKNCFQIIKKRNSFSPYNDNFDLMESAVKSINTNQNSQDFRSKSLSDQFPELLSNLVFKKAMTFEGGCHSSRSGQN